MKLSQKGLLLVSVPLAFELLFVGALFFLLDNAEREARLLAHSRAVIAATDDGRRLGFQIGSSLFVYSLSKSERSRQAVENSMTDLDRISAKLGELVKGDAEQSKLVKEQYETNVSEIRSTVERLKRSIEGSGDLSELASGYRLRNVLVKGAGRISEAIDRIADIERAKGVTPEREQHYRRLVKLALLGGVMFNILLAVWLAIYFNRGTTRRLDVLLDNTVRVAAGKELLPRVQGSDEIARLDDVFHDMADALDKAAQERLQLERLKQEFISMITHDLKTPLAAIQATLGLIEQGTFGDIEERGRQRLAGAERSCDRLLNLISDLIDISRMQEGKLDLHLGICQAKEIIERAVESTQGFAEQQGVKLSCAQAQGQINGDSKRLIQVLVNLISNAIKFSTAGGAVTVAAKLVGDQVEISVTDEGRGIPAAHLDSIFERFKQVEESDASEKRGSGLGLAICKSVIDAHQGSIGVESTEGKGSRFWFRVAAATEDGATVALPAALQSPPLEA